MAFACAMPAGAGAQATGGAMANPVPSISKVGCRADCESVRAAKPGATLVVRGKRFGAVRSIVFLGRKGKRDDAAAAPLRARTDVAVVKIPGSAASGPLSVVNSAGEQSRPSKTKVRIKAPAATDQAGAGTRTQSAPAATAAPRATSSSNGIDLASPSGKVFFDGAESAQLTYFLRHPAGATAVDVELVRVADGVVVNRWRHSDVEADVGQNVVWDGTSGGGPVAKDGQYTFRVYAFVGGAEQAVVAEAPQPFLFLRHKFPVKGKHDYGEFAASYGGGRGHKGQDVFAKCGTPLVAARGGVVKFKQFHSRAGHYLIIDGEATGEDYIYMHLREASPFEKGDRVRTGQVIGSVGDTGRASGCHLHFEIWTAPGWYTGGDPRDPKPDLLAWDKHS